MEKNNELRTAWEFVEHTGHSIFLTGKAGTGKTTFLRALKQKSSKRLVVVAPTGVAAINAGGVTIHSFFQLPFSPFVPDAHIKSRFDFSKEKRKIIRTLDLLVIDEISMVRCDVLDAIDSVLRRFRDHAKPFGGVQLLLIGDLQQLTPVVTHEEEHILSQYYDTPYFFGSLALRRLDYVTIELSRVYRQQDASFINILNAVRTNQATEDHLRRLNERYDPSFRPPAESGYIRLTTHNRMADDYNQSQLHSLRGASFCYRAEVSGEFPSANFPTDQELQLKEGAQVMFVKNDTEGRYYNGRIGHITYLDANTIQVLCAGDAQPIDVERDVWENTRYSLNDETREIETEVLGSFSQFPLRLAWAITIHKSQGLTFEHAIIDAQQSFAPGQVYVALSRCKTLEGLVLATPVSPNAIINDDRVSSYIATQEERAEASIKALPTLRQEYERQLLIELFSFHQIAQQEEHLHRVVGEFFYAQETLRAIHDQAHKPLQDMLAVAGKWGQVILSMPFDQLHDAAFMDRVQRSADYFRKQLSAIFDELIAQTKLIKTGSKVALRRLDTTLTELTETVEAKGRLLTYIAQHGFSVGDYLHAKQMALLGVLDEADPKQGKAKRSRKSKAEKLNAEKTKQKKVPTGEVTYDLFTKGLSVSDIARLRKLTPATISGHLIPYVKQGNIKAEDITGNEKYTTIMRAIAKVGTTEGATPIKRLCDDSITFDDIRVVMAEYISLRK